MSITMGSQAGTSGAAESNPHQFDVFLNHRGPDVKYKFVAHLDAALKRDGCRPFLDAQDIEHGQHVFKSIDNALNGSCVHVVIISEGYAESKYCLNELCDILKSGKVFLPVFYHVDPADLRRIENGPFEEGFRKHSEQETEEQILKWKGALREISVYMGWILDKVNGNEADLVTKIVAEVRRKMSNGRQGQPEALEGGAVEGVKHAPSDTEAPEEPIVTFNLGDRRRNILVLGDPESVEAVIGHICGARRQQTPVEDHVNLTESRNSSQTMYLYRHTEGINNRKFFKDTRNFVKSRNRKWRPAGVEALWVKEVHECSGPRNQQALFPDSIERLHMVWFACRKLSDFPNHLQWPEITKKLCGLPVQILVVEKQRTRDLDMNDQQDFNNILEHGSDFFPNARKFMAMEDLIVKVSFQDDDLKEELRRKCCDVRTRAEIGYVSKIIREIHIKLGPAGKSVPLGVGGATIRKEVSLSRSAEFVLDFLCSYWDIPQNSLRHVLQRSTNSISQACGSTISIKPCEFVEFSLKVAAIILYNARNPNISYESRSDQLLLEEARDCYNSYFELSLYPYDKMDFEDIRLFLESIFERNGWDPRSVVRVDRNSPFSKKITKRIRPR